MHKLQLFEWNGVHLFSIYNNQQVEWLIPGIANWTKLNQKSIKLKWT